MLADYSGILASKYLGQLIRLEHKEKQIFVTEVVKCRACQTKSMLLRQLMPEMVKMVLNDNNNNNAKQTPFVSIEGQQYHLHLQHPTEIPLLQSAATAYGGRHRQRQADLPHFPGSSGDRLAIRTRLTALSGCITRIGVFVHECSLLRVHLD